MQQKMNTVLQNRCVGSLCAHFNEGAICAKSIEMSRGAIPIIRHHVSFSSLNPTSQIHHLFYQPYWTPRNFLFKNRIHCQRFKLLYWGFPGIRSERAIPKEGMQSVLVKGQHHGKRALQRWMLWCGLYSHRLVKFGRLEINQPLSLPDTPIRLWSTTWYNDINSEDNIKQIQD